MVHLFSVEVLVMVLILMAYILTAHLIQLKKVTAVMLAFLRARILSGGSARPHRIHNHPSGTILIKVAGH